MASGTTKTASGMEPVKLTKTIIHEYLNQPDAKKFSNRQGIDPVHFRAWYSGVSVAVQTPERFGVETKQGGVILPPMEQVLPELERELQQRAA